MKTDSKDASLHQKLNNSADPSLGNTVCLELDHSSLLNIEQKGFQKEHTADLFNFHRQA